MPCLGCSSAQGFLADNCQTLKFFDSDKPHSEDSMSLFETLSICQNVDDVKWLSFQRCNDNAKRSFSEFAARGPVKTHCSCQKIEIRLVGCWMQMQGRHEPFEYIKARSYSTYLKEKTTKRITPFFQRVKVRIIFKLSHVFVFDIFSRFACGCPSDAVFNALSCRFRRVPEVLVAQNLPRTQHPLSHLGRTMGRFLFHKLIYVCFMMMS